MGKSEHVLFGKYRLCRKLGSGLSGTVYLAFHMELEEYRAVKIVPKTVAGYESFRKEALFLKDLRHPGIPIVYDVEEDDTNSYLIEEYLEGESLYALVKRLGSLSVNMAVDFGIQICRLIHFMYSAENPILYLDLQPKNLFVCGKTVRLTDFDHACHASDARSFGKRYGTVGFAAPEQYEGGPLDGRTDVYAIGALLYYMYLGRPPGKEPDFSALSPRGIGRLIRGAMARRPEERYPSAGVFLEALLELQRDIQREHAVQSQIIAFAGVRPGIGTTHAAIGLSNFLTRNGCPALYQEAHDSDAARNFAKNRRTKPDRFGICRMGSLNLRPYYGEAVRTKLPYFPFVVEDLGAAGAKNGRLLDADRVVLVCGGKWWELDGTVQAAREFSSLCPGRLALLFNHMDKEFSLALPKQLQAVPAFYLPFFPNPMAGNAADACFRELMTSGTGECDIWGKKGRARLLWKGRRGCSESPESERASARRIFP